MICSKNQPRSLTKVIDSLALYHHGLTRIGCTSYQSQQVKKLAELVRRKKRIYIDLVKNLVTQTQKKYLASNKYEYSYSIL